MDTYIVRIYRRPSVVGGQFAGICEYVEKERKISFENIDQLVKEIMGSEIDDEKQNQLK